MFAKQPTSSYKTALRPQSLIQKKGQDCYLCKGRDHYIKSCPYTIVAVQAASKKQKAKTSSQQLSNKVELKISQLEKTIESLAKELKEVKSKQKSKKAYVAGAIESESSGNDDKHQSEEECQEEAATFCKENVSTTSADTWISDSGASSHMTDNLGFFSKPLRQTGRTPIKVGGGRLYLTQRGTIRIKDISRSQIKLKDVLYVLELEINLLSKRKLCKEELTGYFNNKKMYYQDRLGNTIIEATEKDGVYVLDKITATYNDAGELEEISTGYALSN